VGAEFGVMLVIDGTAMLLHQRKEAPASPMWVMPGLEFFNDPWRGLSATSS